MRIYEILNETGKNSPKKIYDGLKGFTKIDPNPDTTNMDGKFTISYINQDMGKFYNVDPRILSYDRHGHRGVSDPHIHIFQKSKKHGVYKVPDAVTFKQAYDIFMGILAQIIKKYRKDLNERNKN